MRVRVKVSLLTNRQDSPAPERTGTMITSTKRFLASRKALLALALAAVLGGVAAPAMAHDYDVRDHHRDWRHHARFEHERFEHRPIRVEPRYEPAPRVYVPASPSINLVFPLNLG